jgi:hypothetical protein
VRATAFNISTREADDYRSMSKLNFKKHRNIDLVRVEIHTAEGGKKFFEFQSVSQAQKFLDGYDQEKVS